MFLNGKRPPAVTRKVVVQVRKSDDSRASTPTQHASSSSAKRASGSSRHLLKPKNKPLASVHRASVTPRASSTDSRGSSAASTPTAGRARPLKRKAPPATSTPFSSDSDSDSGSDGSGGGGDGALDLLARKRPRPSPGLGAQDVRRNMFRIEADPTPEDVKAYRCRGGAALTSGAKGYRAVFSVDGRPATVKLRYPSHYPRERFELVLPTDDPDDYDPIVDIIQTIEHISRYYFAPEEAKIMNDDVTGFGRRLKRAARDGAFESFRSVVDEFNRTVYKALTDGSMAAVVARSETVALPLVERILAQIYSRTVSPKVNLLKQYENGTDNVYGELLPRFSHGIFLETGLRADDVFVDLGSGVGNVVFQAALEVGCEAWGIEQMPNPASLARAQLAEFRARTALWSCAVGEAHALEGDFLNCPQIDAALRRADVVLINNQAFTPQLNDKIVMKILDFKEGCRIVSLKSFVPIGREISSRNIEDPRNLLTVVRKQYTSGSVSWTDNGGEYFIATKDSMRLQRFSRHG